MCFGVDTASGQHALPAFCTRLHWINFPDMSELMQQKMDDIQQVGWVNLIFLCIQRATKCPTFAQSRARTTCSAAVCLHVFINYSKKFCSLLFFFFSYGGDKCTIEIVHVCQRGYLRKCQVLKWIDVSCCTRSAQCKDRSYYVVSFQGIKHFIFMDSVIKYWWNAQQIVKHWWKINLQPH